MTRPADTNIPEITIPARAYIPLSSKIKSRAKVSNTLTRRAEQIEAHRRPWYKIVYLWVRKNLGKGQQTLDHEAFGTHEGWGNARKKAKAMKIQKIYGFIQYIWNSNFPKKKTRSGGSIQLDEHFNVNITDGFTNISIEYTDSSSNQTYCLRLIANSGTAATNNFMTLSAFSESLANILNTKSENPLINTDAAINRIYSHIIVFSKTVAHVVSHPPGSKSTSDTATGGGAFNKSARLKSTSDAGTGGGATSSRRNSTSDAGAGGGATSSRRNSTSEQKRPPFLAGGVPKTPL